uniref:Neuronatin n=1 Tax=Cavia porcellus TaxID=10141 RepID=A0A286XLM7_CAVPO
MAAVAAASAELLIIGWYIFRVLLQWVSHCRCSDTPCRSWHIRCPGPVERCWGSAGSEPPTEAPAPSPGRPYHQVLLCISASKGANAAQEWGVPCVPSPEKHLPRSVRGR